MVSTRVEEGYWMEVYWRKDAEDGDAWQEEKRKTTYSKINGCSEEECPEVCCDRRG